MTLVEIMIVVIIMSLIATAVGMAVLPMYRDALVTQTRSDAATLRGAVDAFFLGQGEGCPSAADLVAAEVLSGSARILDAWSHDFAIECDGDRITVTSAGPDGRLGTEDDVR